MSTIELETDFLSRVRMLPQNLRLQVADYVEFLIQRHGVDSTQAQPSDEEKIVEQLNAALAEIDQTESLETARAYMKGMGKYIAENNPW